MKEVEQKLSASKGVRQATERERRLASAANKLKVRLGGMRIWQAPVSFWVRLRGVSQQRVRPVQAGMVHAGPFMCVGGGAVACLCMLLCNSRDC